MNEKMNCYQQLRQRLIARTEIEATLKEVKRDIRRLESEVLERFIDEGVSGVRVEDTSLFPKSTSRIQIVGDTKEEQAANRHRAAQVLKDDLGLGEYLKYDFNVNTLSSHYRKELEDAPEVMNAEDILPQELKGLLKFVEFLSVGHQTRK